MAFLAWVFFRVVFAAFVSGSEADQYIAGCIILAAAPCTAMVFVWSHLTGGDPAYTLVQVSVNDLIMLVAFVPIVQFLVTGTSSLTVPFRVLLSSVLVFIVIPLAAGTILRQMLIRGRGKEWFENAWLPRFAPVTIAALLATLVCIFAFQADIITGRFFHVVLIAVPITLQVYLNASLAYGLTSALHSAFADCNRAYETLADANANETVKAFGQERNKLGVLWFNASHNLEHYGNLVVYMRMKGIVPPSSDPKPQ
jgi:arsenite transporter